MFRLIRLQRKSTATREISQKSEPSTWVVNRGWHQHGDHSGRPRWLTLKVVPYLM